MRVACWAHLTKAALHTVIGVAIPPVMMTHVPRELGVAATSPHDPYTERALPAKRRASRLVQRVSNIIGPRSPRFPSPPRHAFDLSYIPTDG